VGSSGNFAAKTQAQIRTRSLFATEPLGFARAAATAPPNFAADSLQMQQTRGRRRTGAYVTSPPL